MSFNDWRDRADSGWKAKGEQKYGGSMGRDVGDPLPPKPDPDFDHAVRQSEKCWRESKNAGTPIWKLRMAHSYLAVLDRTSEGNPIYAASVDELKGTVANILRTADPVAVLGEPRVRELVMAFFGEAGIERLQVRVAAKVAA